MSSSRSGLGIDVSKDRLDYVLSSGEFSGSVDRTTEGVLELVDLVAGLDLHRIVLNGPS